MFYSIEGYLLTCMLFLAGKDATSYLLKDKSDNSLTNVRIRRWHRDGVAMLFLYIAPCLFLDGPMWWEILVAALLIRLSVFDLAFNFYASLPTDFLGSTAIFDKIFSKMFGQHGAVRKAIAFLVLLAGFNYLIFKHIL